MNDILFATEEDTQFYNECIKDLSVYREGLPFSCRAHNIPFFKYVINLLKPKSIFEIGFNLGHSASMWLHLSESRLLSIDVSDKPETLYSSEVLKSKFKNRFTFIRTDSYVAYPLLEKLAGEFDLCFIDGGHLEPDVMNDIQLCKDLNIQWMAFDDWLPEYGPGVQPAIAKHNLDVVCIIGNNALTKVK